MALKESKERDGMPFCVSFGKSCGAFLRVWFLCVGGVRFPKTCQSLLVLFRKENKFGRDLALVKRCSSRICLLLTFCSRSHLGALYAGHMRI